jgi:hypothetical protein
LKHEGESEENACTPPCRLGENGSGLADSNECVWRGAGAAEVCGEAASLAGLQQNCGDEDKRIQNENDEKEIVEHAELKDWWNNEISRTHCNLVNNDSNCGNNNCEEKRFCGLDGDQAETT